MSTTVSATVSKGEHRPAVGAAAATRITSIDAFRGFVMFLMLAEAMRLWTLHTRIPGQPLLVDRRLQHHARPVAGVLAPRPDPAGVLVPRRRRAAVLDREPPGQGGDLRAHARSRHLAQRRADPARHLPPLARAPADQLDLRRHAHPDRPRLHLPVPAGVRVAARADRGLHGDPRRVSGRRSWRIRCPAPASTTRRSACPPDWPHLYTGFLAHFNKNSNLSWAFDVWFLNLFPREAPFRSTAAAGPR